MSSRDCGSSRVDPSAWREVHEFLRTNNWSDAVELLRRLAAETGCREVRLTLGAVLAEREQYHEAIQLWTQVIDDANCDGDRNHLAAAYSNLAAVYRAVGDYDLARRFQQRALQLQDDCGAEDLLHLANDALAASRWELAEALLQSAAELTDDDDPLQTTILATAGLARSLQGQSAEAIELLREAYKRHQAAGDDGEAGRDLLNLAAAYRQMGRLRREEKCLALAADHFERAGAAQSYEMAIARHRQVERLLALQRMNPRVN